MVVYRNDFGYKMPVKGDRESFRYVAELGIRTNRAILERMPGKSHQDVYNPHSIPIESLDMFAGDPNYQQAMMEVTYAIDNYCVMPGSQLGNGSASRADRGGEGQPPLLEGTRRHQRPIEYCGRPNQDWRFGAARLLTG